MGHFTIIVIKTGELYINLWGFNKKENKKKGYNNYKKQKVFQICYLTL